MQRKQVAILEARMGEQLAGLVAQRGGVPFHAPALAELPDLDHQAIGRLVQSLGNRPAKLAIFQTGVGADNDGDGRIIVRWTPGDTSCVTPAAAPVNTNPNFTG